jgi:hypothetical protein
VPKCPPELWLWVWLFVPSCLLAAGVSDDLLVELLLRLSSSAMAKAGTGMAIVHKMAKGCRLLITSWQVAVEQDVLLTIVPNKLQARGVARMSLSAEHTYFGGCLER